MSKKDEALLEEVHNLKNQINVLTVYFQEMSKSLKEIENYTAKMSVYLSSINNVQVKKKETPYIDSHESRK